jgi:hypothetical protein
MFSQLSQLAIALILLMLGTTGACFSQVAHKGEARHMEVAYFGAG